MIRFLVKDFQRVLYAFFSTLILSLTIILDLYSKNTERPNFVLILIDDLGYGDIGCTISATNTPNINWLADKGMKFTDFHSNGPVCTPTRAALLTGQYQQRFGKDFEGPLHFVHEHDKGLPLKALTIAEVLKESGYTTGMYGKWHLGYQSPYLPTNQGFDDFRGLLSGDGDHHTHINRWGKEDWWHNEEIEMEEGYSVDLITEHSIKFIEKHKDEPFFLYVSHLAIHFPWQGPEDPTHRAKGKDYTEDKWGIIENPNNVRAHIKSMIESIDKSVGKIIETLKRLKLDKKTLVIFTSDNGGYIHYDEKFHNISSNGPLRGQKGQVFEGGHRVPCIAYWPGKIKQGVKTDETVMTMDFLPTFAKLANAKIPPGHQLDGVNILPLLLEGKELHERILFWKKGNQVAVRKGPWKLVKNEDNQKLLFNLDEDLDETNNLSDEKPELAKKLWIKYKEWEKELVVQ